MTTTPHSEKGTQNVTKRVFEHIDREHLRPIPRARFVLQNVALWAFGILSILFGAIAAAAALFALANAGWRYYVATHDNFLTFLVQSAPFLWLLSLAVFVLIGYELFRHTKTGYRYSFVWIVTGSVALSIALGGALYTFGLGEVFEETIGTYVPFYQPTIAATHAMWVHPERGLLAGNVLAFASDTSSFTLRAFDGSVWTIDSDDLRGPDNAVLAKGGLVRIVGVPLAQPVVKAASSTRDTDGALFHACFVFPWEVYGAFGGAHIAAPMQNVLHERKVQGERSEECKGVRPYTPLRALEEEEQASSTSP